MCISVCYIASKTTSLVYFNRLKSHGFVYYIDRSGGLYYVSFSCMDCWNHTNIIKFIVHKHYLIMFLFSYCAVSFNRYEFTFSFILFMWHCIINTLIENTSQKVVYKSYYYYYYRLQAMQHASQTLSIRSLFRSIDEYGHGLRDVFNETGLSVATVLYC